MEFTEQEVIDAETEMWDEFLEREKAGNITVKIYKCTRCNEIFKRQENAYGLWGSNCHIHYEEVKNRKFRRCCGKIDTLLKTTAKELDDKLNELNIILTK